MTCTIQKEVAERIVARPGSKDYGALAIWMQSQCRAGSCGFWRRRSSGRGQRSPRPSCRSCWTPPFGGGSPIGSSFTSSLRAMFFHRRKFLRSQLLSACKDRLDKGGVDRVLEDLRLDPTDRAENLDIDTMLALCEAVKSKGLGIGD